MGQPRPARLLRRRHENRSPGQTEQRRNDGASKQSPLSTWSSCDEGIVAAATRSSTGALLTCLAVLGLATTVAGIAQLRELRRIYVPADLTYIESEQTFELWLTDAIRDYTLNSPLLPEL